MIKRKLVILALTTCCIAFTGCGNKQILEENKNSKVVEVTDTTEVTVEPTEVATIQPIVVPTKVATVQPTVIPTVEPTKTPTVEPTIKPTVKPTVKPTETVKATKTPTKTPTKKSEVKATKTPTKKPTPTKTPTKKPTPTKTPTKKPTSTKTPTKKPSDDEKYKDFKVDLSFVNSDPAYKYTIVYEISQLKTLKERRMYCAGSRERLDMIIERDKWLVSTYNSYMADIKSLLGRKPSDAEFLFYLSTHFADDIQFEYEFDKSNHEYDQYVFNEWNLIYGDHTGVCNEFGDLWRRLWNIYKKGSDDTIENTNYKGASSPSGIESMGDHWWTFVEVDGETQMIDSWFLDYGVTKNSKLWKFLYADKYADIRIKLGADEDFHQGFGIVPMTR